MTEREAIEILSRPFSMQEVPKEILDAHRLAIAALEKQEQDRWIPCSVRLPELDTDVLITDQYGDIWQATYIDWCGDERFVTAEESITIEVVVAWRPLPDPYKAEEES